MVEKMDTAPPQMIFLYYDVSNLNASRAKNMLQSYLNITRARKKGLGNSANTPMIIVAGEQLLVEATEKTHKKLKEYLSKIDVAEVDTEQ